MVDTTESAWEAVLAAEPKPRLTLRGEEIDRAGHHERLDGKGYHREAPAAAQSPTRDSSPPPISSAMTEPRPYRAPLSPEQAAEVLTREATGRRLDPDMVKLVVEADGQPAPEVERPASLTQREAEIVGLIARGLLTKQVARALDISPKTADHHIQNTYRKMGVSSRAAATLFAMEHGLVSWAGGVFAETQASAPD